MTPCEERHFWREWGWGSNFGGYHGYQYGACPGPSKEETLESCLSRNNGNVQQQKLEEASRADDVRKKAEWRTRSRHLGM